ncbi:hypothetical protein FOZ63_022767, partial [Perkinsus olseni]
AQGVNVATSSHAAIGAMLMFIEGVGPRLRPSGTDPFLCSICKTGQACVDGESHDVAWLAAVTGTRSSRGRQSPWEVLGSFGARSDNSSDSDEDDDLFADSEGVEDSP